jgi:hypothetical protein
VAENIRGNMRESMTENVREKKRRTVRETEEGKNKEANKGGEIAKGCEGEKKREEWNNGMNGMGK